MRFEITKICMFRFLKNVSKICLLLSQFSFEKYQIFPVIKTSCMFGNGLVLTAKSQPIQIILRDSCHAWEKCVNFVPLEDGKTITDATEVPKTKKFNTETIAEKISSVVLAVTFLSLRLFNVCFPSWSF